jgi:rare lipoprotein A
MVGPGEPAPKGGVYRVGKPYIVGGRECVPQDVNESAAPNNVPKLPNW